MFMLNLCPLQAHEREGAASQCITTSCCSPHAAQQQQQSSHKLQPAQIKGYLTFKTFKFSLLGLKHFLLNYFKRVHLLSLD